jgi:uncharacterized protein
VTYPRQVLNALRWKPGEDLAEAWITYVHRGAPGDEMTVPGSDVVELERSFFVTKEAKIPYHRIKLIRYRWKVLFDLQKASSKDAESPEDKSEGKGF